ncbi:MAG: cobalamin biosynthesis protein, partial [Bacillota bacterium]
MSLYLLLDVFIAYVLDIFLGDPHWLPHPVRLIGWLVKKMEELMRGLIRVSSVKKVKALGEDVIRKTRKTYRNEKLVGVIFALFVIAIISLIVF